MHDLISFRVVKEPYGWAVRTHEGLMTPFQSRRSAIEHASAFVDALRRQGHRAEIVVEELAPIQPATVRRDGARFRFRIGAQRA